MYPSLLFKELPRQQKTPRSSRFAVHALLRAIAIAIVLAMFVASLMAAPAGAAPAAKLTTLHSFTGPDGAYLWAGLTLGSDGNFYGTAETGGNATGDGTVFKMTPGGALTTLYSFSGPDGAGPFAGLVEGSDGNFYGETSRGGPGGDGTIFKITPAGVLTTLYAFSGPDGNYATSGLILGSDGNFYGMTNYGGISDCENGGCGTIFKITPAGVLTTLYFFTYYIDGFYPVGSLVQGSDGNFYGTTSEGGAIDAGTVFMVTPIGAFTSLYSFQGAADGGAPYAGLVQGSDGNFYGTTTANGGPDLDGTVFKITPSGTLTTLHTMVFADGNRPYASLVQGSDGNFYGTAPSDGGHNGYGTVFSVTPSGTFTVLSTFPAKSHGGTPAGALLPGNDGNFYGTTSQLGTDGYGTIFEIHVRGAAAPAGTPGRPGTRP